MTKKFGLVGTFENPTVIDADTGEPLYCFEEVEILMKANPHEVKVKLTVDYQELDLSRFNTSHLEQRHGGQSVLDAWNKQHKDV